MRSLVLTHYRPLPLMSGSTLRNWQNIRALASFGPVDVVTVGVEDVAGSFDGVAEWAPFSLTDRSAWDRVRTACSPLRAGTYPGVELYRCAPVTSWLKDRARRGQYDVAVIETLPLAGYFRELRRTAERVVFDAHNVEGELQPSLDSAHVGPSPPLRERIKNRILASRIVAAERRVITDADLVWVCSEDDKRAVKRTYGRGGGVTVVPNAVDVAAYRSTETVPAATAWNGVPVTMVYPGLFAYPPNEEAGLRLIREVLPLVRAAGYNARVVLVGRDPTARLLEAAHACEGVEVTGRVESVVPYLSQPCVVTVPLNQGGGTRLKILEAFAVGRPVVSTSRGAEGIDVLDGTHLLIRDDSESMAEAVLDLWNSPQLRGRLCAAALDLVGARYSWDAAADAIAATLGCGSPRGLALPLAQQPRAASADVR